MGRIFDSASQFFSANGWDMTVVEGQEALAARFENEDGNTWGCLALPFEDAEQLAFYSVLLEPVPPEHQAQMTDFIMRANYGMQVGNFEMDVRDGEVRFKTSIDIEGTELTEVLWRNVVELNVMLMGLYFDGLQAVSRGDKTGAEAIAEIEDAQDDD